MSAPLNLRDFLETYCLEPADVQPALYGGQRTIEIQPVGFTGYVPDNSVFVATQFCLNGLTQARFQIFENSIARTPSVRLPLNNEPVSAQITFQPRSTFRYEFSGYGTVVGASIELWVEGFFVFSKFDRLIHQARVLGFNAPPLISGSGVAGNLPFAINTISISGDPTGAIALQIYRLGDLGSEWNLIATLDPTTTVFIDDGEANGGDPVVNVTYAYRANYLYPSSGRGDDSNVVEIFVFSS